MNKFGDLLTNLKDTLFGKKEKTESAKERQDTLSERDISSQASNKSESILPERTDPLIVQIGFDFGTAYSKCICRDIITNKAWVHIPTEVDNKELPFLIRGTLNIEDGKLKKLQKTDSYNSGKVLYNLKQALEKIALHEWKDPILETYSIAIGTKDPKKLAIFIEACAVYFLAGALGDVKNNVRQRLNASKALPEDYIAVNLAVPVADAERPQINKTYHRALCMAWQLADTLSGHPPIALNELEGLLCCYDSSVQEACFIYPEVSANVQGFVRSRASSPGMYLFSDTGAGTVDQGIFIFDRDSKNKEYLTYLHGSVLPLGSSYIERYAAEISKDVSFNQLEYWREAKERGESSKELNKARDRISEQLSKGTAKTIESSLKKLFVKDQISGIRTIFGGGGHCNNPYQSAVMRPFSGSTFKKPFTPDIVGLPHPHDLDIGPGEERWLHRLSVAYGLSFLKNELTRFIYPVDVSTPTPEEIWKPNVATQTQITDKKPCSCGGINPDCFRCDGTGLIKQRIEKRVAHTAVPSPNQFRGSKGKNENIKCICGGNNKFCFHCKGTGIISNKTN